MRCYYVLVHGILDWHGDDGFQPRGFYCHRFVLAGDEASASKIAFDRVRSNLDKETGWLSDGAVTLRFEAEQVAVAPLRKLLGPDDRGHTFYDQE